MWDQTSSSECANVSTLPAEQHPASINESLNSAPRGDKDSSQALEKISSLSLADTVPKLDQLKQNLAGVIQGKSDPIDILIIALLAGGSVLMEDVPGVGKTTLAKALARSLDVEFRRIQFTPDLLPTDILGSSIYSPADGSFTFRSGPIFCSVLLADEINRASPRTQSALLEAMSERQVTIEGNRLKLPDPFLVLATQNPIDFHGTYPLPEAQLDRFLVHLNIGYPDPATEADMLYAQANDRPIDQVSPVLSIEDIVGAQSLVRNVHVDRSIAEYIVRIVQETRNHHQLRLGVSPRGSLMFFRAVQAAALFSGRDHVLPDDILQLVQYVLPHRCILTSQAKYSSSSKADIIAEIVRQVRIPV
ncbi:MAG: MoxR family ATPase [Planctomycetaceae bacterium]|nr:MoxR family ATPase [Planctomycetaceae bacterium]